MSQSSLQRRFLVVVAVVVPLLAVVFLAPHANAQRPGVPQPGVPQPPRPPVFQPQPQPPVGQPGMPRPPQPPVGIPGSSGVPQYENVWYCSKCNSELGRGAVKPTLSRCPKCSASFGSGTWGIGGIIGLVVAGLGFLFRKMRE